jgi:hypothetical protein
MTGFKSKKEMAMSKVKDMSYEIQELFIEGYGAISIAAQLGIPLDQVYATLDSFGVARDDVAETPQPDQDYYGA